MEYHRISLNTNMPYGFVNFVDEAQKELGRTKLAAGVNKKGEPFEVRDARPKRIRDGSQPEHISRKPPTLLTRRSLRPAPLVRDPRGGARSATSAISESGHAR